MPSATITPDTDRRSVRRCPACGHRFNPPSPPECPLCAFDLGDSRVTGTDVTPYAQAYATGATGWWAMCVWVFLAGHERLKHLALMRSSAASRRFARTNLALLVLGVGLFQQAHVGWRPVTGSVAIEQTGSLEPAGDGWYHAAASPRPIASGVPAEMPVDLWYNVLQCAIGVVTGMTSAVLFSWLVMVLMRAGTRRSHDLRYRDEERMTAALHYNTAWCLPILLAAIVTGLLPLAYIGDMAQWRWHPSVALLQWAGASVCVFGVCMWWFSLIRLAATAPVWTRSRVVLFFAAGAPLIVGGVSAVWYFGLDLLGPVLTRALNLEF